MRVDLKLVILLLETCILQNFALVEKRRKRLVLAAPAPAPGHEGSKKIVGGRFCDTSEYPYAVAVFGDVACGGTLLTLQWVLTAGHCVMSPYPDESTPIAVRSGFTSSERFIQLRDASKTLVHDKFDINKLTAEIPELRYDIAMVMVEKPFKETSHLKPVTLPHLGYTKNCKTATVIGMGVDHIVDYTKDFINRPLKCVELQIVNSSTCAETYPGSVIDDHLICTMERVAGKDACQGDSGGPMMCGKVLIGVVSYGKGCGMANHSASFTRVESFLRFINKTLHKDPKQIHSDKRSNGSDKEGVFWTFLCIALIVLR